MNKTYPGLRARMIEREETRKKSAISANGLRYNVFTNKEIKEINVLIEDGINTGKTLEVIKTNIRDYILKKGIKDIKSKLPFLQSDKDLIEIEKILKNKTKSRKKENIDFDDIFNSINEYLGKKGIQISASAINKMREVIESIIESLELIESRFASQIKDKIRTRDRNVTYNGENTDILIRYYISQGMNADQVIAVIMKNNPNYNYDEIEELYVKNMQEMDSFLVDFQKRYPEKMSEIHFQHYKKYPKIITSLITEFFNKSDDDKYSNLDTGKCIIPEEKGKYGKKLTGNGIEILSSYFRLYIKNKGIKISGKRTDEFRNSMIENDSSNNQKNKAVRTKGEEQSTTDKTAITVYNGEIDVPGE